MTVNLLAHAIVIIIVTNVNLFIHEIANVFLRKFTHIGKVQQTGVYCQDLTKTQICRFGTGTIKQSMIIVIYNSGERY